MRTFRPTAGVQPTALVLLALFLSFGCVASGRTAHDATTTQTEGRRTAQATSRAGTTAGGPEGRILSASIPARDARGRPVPGLPRHPGSVRVGYSEREADGLTLVRAAYLARERPAGVRGLYRGVFRAGGWQVANVDYSGDGWRFLVVRGDREAGVEVIPRDGGSEVGIELSGPAQGFGASAGGSKR